MPKNNIYDHGFDPYDALIELNERLIKLEQVHNQLARDYTKSQADLNVALHSLRQLQKSYLTLSQLVNSLTILNQK